MAKSTKRMPLYNKKTGFRPSVEDALNKNVKNTLGLPNSSIQQVANKAISTQSTPPLPTTSQSDELEALTGGNTNGTYSNYDGEVGPPAVAYYGNVGPNPEMKVTNTGNATPLVRNNVANPSTDHDILNDKEISRDYGGALLGIGQAGLAAALQGKNSWETIRRREKEVDQALQSNLQDRERILNQTPEATRRAQAAQLNQGKSLAVQAAANVGAGQASQAGLSGGDVNSAVLSAVKAAAPVMQASQGYDSQLSSNYGQRDAAEANINNQAMQNTMSRAQIADMTHYVDREHEADNTWANFAANLTNAGLNGVNALDNWKTMGDQTNRVSKKTAWDTIVNPDGTESDVIANTRNIVSQAGRQR